MAIELRHCIFLFVLANFSYLSTSLSHLKNWPPILVWQSSETGLGQA